MDKPSDNIEINNSSSIKIKNITNSQIDSHSETTYNIFIKPDKFSEQYNFNVIDKEWIINTTNIFIPDSIKAVLQLGQKFNLPNNLSNKEKITDEFIKHIENNIKKLQIQDQNVIRNESIPILQSINYKEKNTYAECRGLKDGIRSVEKFIKDHPDILITRADKGNSTVILDLNEYKIKMNEILSDSNTYMTINKDFTKKLTTETHNLLVRFRNKGYIDQFVYKKLYVSDGVLPRSYGLPKIHKEGYPLRLIVSCINSPIYPLATFLKDIIEKSMEKNFSYIKNSFELVNKLNGKPLNSDYKLVSFDVVSMYTNIPVELVMKSIEIRWECITKNTKIPFIEFKNALTFILNSTYFKFDNKYYKQIFGMPMGSPLSPVLSNIVMQDLEEYVFATINIHIPIYYRYVDDILLSIPKNHIEQLLSEFNSYHDRIKFTMEDNDDGSINFLDVKVMVKDDRIIFDLYKKPTNSGRYLNFNSNHPITHKRGVIISFFDRIIYLSHPTFHNKNINNMIEILLNNGYPIKFIFSTINNRIKSLSQKYNRTIITSTAETNVKKFFTVPYLNNISEKFNKICNKFEFNISYKPMNSLNKFISTGKDKLEKDEHSNVIYKINCTDCDCSYVGQTKRKLKTRLNEHKSDLRKSSNIHSVVSNHQLNHNHSMDWDDTLILDSESTYYKRLVSEMIHIKKQKSGINKQSDTEKLPDVYLPILANFTPSI